MHRLRRYIISHFTVLFFSIFTPLFAIASVIFMIKLATYTSVVQMSVGDMTRLYLFVLPDLLFYTLPVTFFVAATLTLHKFSTDNEMIVIFSLGIRPRFIQRTLMTPALLLTGVLVFDFFILKPHTETLSTNFMRYKKSEAKFNLSASEFGHNFGDWLLYIGKANHDNSYGDVFLFHKDVKEELLIGASKAQVKNDHGILTLKLTDGQGYAYSDKKLSQMNFDDMAINNVMVTELRKHLSPIEYWLDPNRRNKKIQAFVTNTLLSLFPLISLYLIPAIGIVHERHQKGHVYLWLFLSILIYYGATVGLQGVMGIYTIPLIAFFWVISTYFLYQKKVARRF